MERKRILFFSDHLQVGGGVEKVFSTLENELSKKFKTFYLGKSDLKPREGIIGKFLTFNEKYKKRNSIIKFLLLIIRAYKLKNICKKYKIDYVISGKEQNNYSVLLSKIIFKNKSKIFCSTHTNVLNYLNSKIDFYLIKLLYPFSNKIISISKEQENDLKRIWNLKI